SGVRVLEATAPRELIARVARPLLLFRLLTRYRLGEMREYGLPRSVITHRVDVRRYAAQKRTALAAHRTPVSGRGRGARLLRVLLRSPLPVFRAVCGTEWFAEPGGRTGELVARDQAAGPGPTELQRSPAAARPPSRSRRRNLAGVTGACYSVTEVREWQNSHRYILLRTPAGKSCRSGGTLGYYPGRLSRRS